MASVVDVLAIQAPPASTPDRRLPRTSLPHPLPSSCPPFVTQHHERIAHAAQCVLPLVARLRSQLRDAAAPRLELEARFGSVQRTGFAPGVATRYWDACLRRVQQFARWTRIDDWEETRDYLYSIGDGRTVRTSVGVRESGATRRSHVEKTVLGNRDFRCVDLLAPAGGDESARTGQDVRVALASERAVAESELPPVVVASSLSLVRIKQRKSYQYGAWSFDFTLSWSGRTKAEAEARQKATPPVLEIETELRDPAAYLQSAADDDWRVAVSLLLKMTDFYTDLPCYYLAPVEPRNAPPS